MPDRLRFAATVVFASVLMATAGLGHAWQVGYFDCDHLVVASSQEKYELLSGFARSYNAAGHLADGHCVTVAIDQVNSGEAEQALEAGWDPFLGARPDVWSPASTAWVALLQQRSASGAGLIPAGQASSLFQSPLVIAMPQPMARALGYPDRSVGWTEILALVRNSEGWGSVQSANPAWGRFKFGKTDPTVSTSGLHALLGTYFAASGGNLTVQGVNDPGVRDFAAGIETSVVHYGLTAKTFLTNLSAADSQDKALDYVSAIAVEEEELIKYNRGWYDPKGISPATPLVAIYPREGTAVADHPFVTLRWSRKQAAAADFLDFVGQGAQQKLILAEGFRNNSNQLGKDVLTAGLGVQPNPPGILLQTNDGAVLEAIVGQWRQIRKHARVLILVDVASQDAPSGGISWATVPLSRAIGRFDAGGVGDPGDEIALWTFPSPPDPYLATPFGVTPGNFVAILGGLKPSSSSADLDGVLASAIAAMTASYEPSRIDAILLMTGSPVASQAADLKLQRMLRSQPGDRFVRVFVVGPPGLPPTAIQRLKTLALAGRGGLYQPNSTQRLIADVVSNF